MSSNGDPDDAWSGQTNPEADDPPEEAEPVEAEVVHHNPALSAEVQALSTFSEQEGPLSFRIIPAVVGNGQTDWRLNIFLAGTQGPVYQNRDGLTNEARDEFGISTRLQDRINSALAYARENLEIPPSLGNMTREKRSLHELEIMMQEG